MGGGGGGDVEKGKNIDALMVAYRYLLESPNACWPFFKFWALLNTKGLSFAVLQTVLTFVCQISAEKRSLSL